MKSKQKLIEKWESAIEAAEFYGKGKEERLIEYMREFVSDLNQLDEPKITELDALNRLAQNVQFSADEIANHLERLSAYNGQVTYGNQEILSQDWIDEHKKSYTMEDSVEISDLQNLLVPKKELPVIPEYVGEYLELAKNDVSLMRVMELANTRYELPRWEKEYDWISENSETFARAWLDGHTVKKEQKYYAKIKGWELFADFVGAQYWGVVSKYGRLGFVNIDGAKDKTKDEWKRLGIDESNADFVKVGEELN